MFLSFPAKGTARQFNYAWNASGRSITQASSCLIYADDTNGMRVENLELFQCVGYPVGARRH